MKYQEFCVLKHIAEYMNFLTKIIKKKSLMLVN